METVLSWATTWTFSALTITVESIKNFPFLSSPICYFFDLIIGQTESKMVENRLFAQVDDLQPNTLYGVTLSAVNSVGSSKKTKSVKFKTDPEPPEGQVTQVEVYSDSSQSLVVTWKVSFSKLCQAARNAHLIRFFSQPPHPDLQHGTILTYSIGYRLANSTEPFRYVSVDARDPNVSCVNAFENTSHGKFLSDQAQETH